MKQDRTDSSERKHKISAYIRNLRPGDKVKFCGVYGFSDTYYYQGKVLGKTMFSYSPLGITYPLGNWRKNILLPEEWSDDCDGTVNADK